MRWRRTLIALIALMGVPLALVAARASNPALDKAIVDLGKNNGLAAEQELWTARQAGASEADTHHLMAHAFLLQGNAVRALQEADASQVPAPFGNYAARVRIKSYLLMNNLSAARAELDAALAHTPSDAALWADMSRLRAKDGDLAGAIIAAQKATTLDPKNVDALLLSATLARDQSGLRAAVPWFDRVLAVDPKNVPALLELAATQGDSGEAVAMLATTRRVLAVDLNNAQAFYLQAVVAARANHPDLARTLLYRASPALDQLPGVMLVRGIIELQSGNVEQAITQLRLLLTAQPSNMRVRRLLGGVYAQAGDDYSVIDTLLPLATRPDADSYTLTTIARAYENLDERVEAATYLDRAAIPAPGASTPFEPDSPLSLLARNDSESPNNAEDAIPFMQGLILSGNLEDALGKAQNLAALNPGVPVAHVLVGDAQMALNHFPQAAVAYRQAAAINLTEPTVMRLINALQRSGDARRAGAVLAHFLAQNPTNLSALNLAANQDIAMGNWRSAIERLEQLRTRTGNNDANLLNSLAWCWLNAGEPERAIPFARAAYALQLGNPAIANTYGWIIFQIGLNRPSGLALLEKAASIAPNTPALRLQLGEAYAILGRKKAARFILTPIANNPSLTEHQAAAKLLARL